MQQMEPQRRLGGGKKGSPLPRNRRQEQMVRFGQNDQCNVEGENRLRRVETSLLRRDKRAEPVALILAAAWVERFFLRPAWFAVMILTAGRGGNALGRRAMTFRATVRRMPTPSSYCLDEEQTRHQIGYDCLHSFTGPPLAYHYDHRPTGQSKLRESRQNRHRSLPRASHSVGLPMHP